LNWAQALCIALSSALLAGCERTVAEIRGNDPREEIEVKMPRMEAATCVLREYEGMPRGFGQSIWTLAMRDFPSENLTELISASGIVITSMVDVRGTQNGAVVIVYRPSNVLPQGNNNRLVAAAQNCQQRGR
jgi:hypothetical protein